MSSTYLIQSDLTTTPTIAPTPFKFPLDPFQQHAVSAIQQEHNVLVCAKTGSGKTLVGEYQIHYSLAKEKRVFYTTPIKSLSNQKFYDLVREYPSASVGIMTGDIKFRPDAQIVIMTTEILRNLLYKKGSQTEHLGLTASLSTEGLDAVIIDECHYIKDPDRGQVWEETMILLPPDVKLVLLSATLDRPELFAAWLGALKERPIHLIQTAYRIVPLTHTLLIGERFVPLMDAREVFDDRIYKEWLTGKAQAIVDHKAFQAKVKAQRVLGIEGTIDGKTRPKDFTHSLNETIGLLQRTEKLPALFFVLSRKGCEEYASKISHDLLTSSETNDVTHIIGFHLSRYKSLSTLPQFHRISDLLKRGIAFHHSGLLPLLKEIVEILFTKGLVRVLFATETFAVGLNMPTKTVVFTGLKKYDDSVGGMRLLRTDEYIQMAGRAGRRGKDVEGLVVYLPDRDPIELAEMRQIMKGAKTPIQSRMDFHYDFILKTLQTGTIKWLSLMEQSYWFRQRMLQIEEVRQDIEQSRKEIGEIQVQVDTKIFAELEEKTALETGVKTATNKAQKEFQRKLGQWNNSHVGPKYVIGAKLFGRYNILVDQVKRQEADLKMLEAHSEHIGPAVEFLKRAEFLHDNATTLSRDSLTLHGILATEVNEGHPILLPELYLSKKAHGLTGEELVCLLAAFLENTKRAEDEGKQTSVAGLEVSAAVKECLLTVDSMAAHFSKMETSISSTLSSDDFWNLTLDWIEPVRLWLEGEHIARICTNYGIFEGNFTRGILKIGNLLDEWLAIATFCENPEQIEKIVAIKPVLIRDIIMPDSLYLRI